MHEELIGCLEKSNFKQLNQYAKEGCIDAYDLNSLIRIFEGEAVSRNREYAEESGSNIVLVGYYLSLLLLNKNKELEERIQKLEESYDKK